MDLYKILSKLEIVYDEVEHMPVFTVQEAQSIKEKISGVGCKNLFLTDKKSGKYLLVILKENKQANLQKIADFIGSSRLSFAKSCELHQVLHLDKGCVSPLGLIHDTSQRVIVLIDSEIQGERILFHPNINTKTMAIQFCDLIKFIEYTNHSYFFLQEDTLKTTGLIQ